MTKQRTERAAKRTERAGRAQRDIIETITARIESALENGTAPWVKPWRDMGCTSGAFPRNGVTGKRYRGLNVPQLWLTSEAAGYTSEFWLTFRQAKRLGGHIRKGEKSTPIVFWKFGKRTERDASTGEETEHTFAMARGYAVFNLEQCEGVTLPKRLREELAARPTLEELKPGERIEPCDSFIAATGLKFIENGDRACYIPSADEIHCPRLEQFTTSDEFYGTAFHECTHATGAKHRLDRLTHARFGSEEYAKEELVAECGAAFLCALMGVNVNGVDQHGAYLASWLKALKDDRRFLVSAFSKAQAAVDWLTEAAGVGAEVTTDPEEVEAEMAAAA